MKFERIEFDGNVDDPKGQGAPSPSKYFTTREGYHIELRADFPQMIRVAHGERAVWVPVSRMRCAVETLDEGAPKKNAKKFPQDTAIDAPAPRG